MLYMFLIQFKFQPINGQMSEVKLHIPFYVSYVTLNRGRSWTTVNMDTDLLLSFVYSTTELWENGVMATSNDLSKKGIYSSHLIFISY